MKLVCQTKLQFREGNSDKVYEVDLCESGSQYVVNFRYGRSGAELKEGTKTVAPVTLAEAQKIFQKLVDEKTRKGYHAVGASRPATAEKPESDTAPDHPEEARRNAILAGLRDAKARSNPRIERLVWRAGELKIMEAAPEIVKLIGTAKELRDYCCAWSLGFCGGEAALPALEKLAGHKAEFVARIAREALLKTGGEEKRRELREKALAELPETLRTLAKSGTPESFEAALRAELQKPARGALTVLSRLYEAENAVIRPALLALLREIPLKPRYFKPFRQIFKAAEYRRDAEVFGIVAKRFEIERAGFTSPSYWDSIYLPDENGYYRSVKFKKELVKPDSRIAFGDRTKDYFRRRTWRTLRRLAQIGDADYVRMATGALLAYADADACEPRVSTHYDYYHTGRWNWQNPKITTTRWSEFSPYLLFNHILYENSPRYELKPGSRGFRIKGDYKIGDPAPAVREEAFPKLWEAQPVGLLHLLAESECRPVHEFAVKALRDCREFIETLDTEALLMLLERPYEVTNRLGFALAAARFDPSNPDVALAVAVAVCRHPGARAQAFEWIEAQREIFAKNETAIRRLLTCAFADARRFGARLLQSTIYAAAEARTLIAVLIAELLALGEDDRAIAADLGDAIFQSFARELRTLDPAVVGDLLAHPLVEVQTLGANILVNHETRAENLPDGLIDALINSPFEQIRGFGIRLFGQLPDENLLRRERTILTFLAHELADIHYAIRPTVARLAARFPQFAENLTKAVVIGLLQPERTEGVHRRLLETAREIPGWTKFVDFETARLLVASASPAAGELGGRLLIARAADWSENLPVDELVGLTNHEILAVRRASWTFAENAVDTLRGEVSGLLRALDAKWADSREFWRAFFRTKFSGAELTPEILVAICDSVNVETQKFGRDLLLEYFKAENGVEYLVKLSEHPAENMQFFATGYLEDYAADAPDRLARLAPYFVRVLSLVNRARAAKKRVLRFLEREGLKSPEAARVAAGILARQSATIAVGDRAKIIETMLAIRRRFPEIELPLKIKPTEVRANAV
ncbi:MAG: WGR domain-containing protein [Acidobacteria bacterium]|nr:WGR domain-containing protein [Acidobacteriota bacterium]